MLFSVWLFSKNFVLRYFFSCAVSLYLFEDLFVVSCYYVHTYTMHMQAIVLGYGWTQKPDTKYVFLFSLFDCFGFVYYSCQCAATLQSNICMIFLTFGLLLLILLFISFYEVAIWLFFLFFFFFFALCHLNNEIRYWDEENMVSKSNWERELMHITEINSLAVTFADRFLFVNGFLFRHSSFRKCYYERAVWMCMCAFVCLWQRENELSIVSTWNRDQHFLFRFNAIQK